MINFLIIICFAAIFGIYMLSIYDYIKDERDKKWRGKK